MEGERRFYSAVFFERGFVMRFLFSFMAALVFATFANAQQAILTAVKITDVPSVEAVRWQYQQTPQPAPQPVLATWTPGSRKSKWRSLGSVPPGYQYSPTMPPVRMYYTANDCACGPNCPCKPLPMVVYSYPSSPATAAPTIGQTTAPPLYYPQQSYTPSYAPSYAPGYSQPFYMPSTGFSSCPTGTCPLR